MALNAENLVLKASRFKWAVILVAGAVFAVGSRQSFNSDASWSAVMPIGVG